MKDIDDHYNSGSLDIDNNYNNIFDLDDPYIKSILAETVELNPPKDYDYNKIEEETEAAKKRQEDKKIDEIDNALKLLTNVLNRKDLSEKLNLRSIASFKMKLDPAIRDSEVEVYVKAIMNQVVEEKLELEKNSGQPIIVQSTGRQEIRVYLNPMKSDPENVEMVATLSPIGDWSLGALYPSNAKKTNASDGVTYWSVK